MISLLVVLIVIVTNPCEARYGPQYWMAEAFSVKPGLNETTP